MNLSPSPAQVLVTYLGEKVILTNPVDDGLYLYPMGSVGTFDSITSKPGREPVAVVQFDNCPVQDWVEVKISDLLPLEFVTVPKGFELKDIQVKRSPSFKRYK